MAEETLVEWSEIQPDWVRDALRRHASSVGFELCEAEKDAIFRNVAYSAGLDVEPLFDAEPLTADHLSRIVCDGPRTVLCSLGPVQRLNRLATNQRLTFGINGITLIYGDNGSGKSGYCRIAKKICRSSTAEDLLGNVLEAEAPAEPAEVVVRYRLDGEADVVEETWVDGTRPPPSISQISVFDSKNARFFIDKKNRIGFLPADIALLQCHGAHRKEMGLALEAEIKTVTDRVAIPLPSGYSEGGDVAVFFSRLDPTSTAPLPTVGEIEQLAAWTAGEDEELRALEDILSNDPAILADKYARAKGVLETYAQHIAAAEDGLSQAAADQLKAAYEEVRTTAEVAALAAAGDFEADPLPFTGQQVWQRMYEHAKDFAISIDPKLTELPQAEGDLCLLCQQPLSEVAADRIQRFNHFVAAEASKAAQRAIAMRDSAMKALGNLAIPTKEHTALSLGEYGTLGEGPSALAEAVVDFIDVAHLRRVALRAAAINGQFVEIANLPLGLHDRLVSDLGDLEQERAAYQRAATDEAHWAPHRQRLSVLRDRRKLSQDLATVIARRADVERLRKLRSALAAVEVKSVSLQITKLRRALVMKGLEERIHDEISRLELNHIPFVVKDQSRDGQSFFDVGLKAARTVTNDKVLSEGEQRALALACFLGELALDDAKHGLVIDDPVSSLDHIRMRRAAERLVAEAGEGRQLIIFTHNLLFFNEMVEAAARANPPVPLARRFIRKSETEGFGLISDTDEPWIAQSVTKRIEGLRARLQALQGVTDFDTDEWRRTAKDFYTDLRETWERLVEEILLSKVVERLNSDVRTQSLKGVIIDDDDHRTVYWAMKAVSERSGHDMAVARAVPTPTPADMKADLDRISEYREAIQRRRKETVRRREGLEQPPVAEAV